MMKNLAYFQREGLIVQGCNSVWVPLGEFGSEAEAASAPIYSRWGNQISDSRIVPLFRDTTGGYRELRSQSEEALRATSVRAMEQSTSDAVPVVLA